ncbi:MULTISPECIES: VC1380 family protein [Vibrio]|uniref:Uncharacterized protein n=1 Tax=Vibrio ostreae TaxID=2841925 RepID=A0A975UDL1_9VIBR|nr:MULTISPECIES: hypothetical protein [Vibrio]QXO18791.1 hypothetical protein KNV97_11215 [Vibrio ostreae]WGY46908.1 hypothetical protein J0X00_19185 [Vibrio sp. ABG19]
MKVSEFKALLDALPADCDPDIVMGEVWLPEQLVAAQLDQKLLFLEFDNAPEEGQGDEEGRGFVEHEIELIREQITQLLQEDSSQHDRIEAMLGMLLVAHERTSSEFIEMLGTLQEEQLQKEL